MNTLQVFLETLWPTVIGMAAVMLVVLPWGGVTRGSWVSSLQPKLFRELDGFEKDEQKQLLEKASNEDAAFMAMAHP